MDWVPVGLLFCFFAFEMTGSHFLLRTLSEVVCLEMLHDGLSPSLSYLSLSVALPPQQDGGPHRFQRHEFAKYLPWMSGRAEFSVTSQKTTKDLGMSLGPCSRKGLDLCSSLSCGLRHIFGMGPLVNII